MFYPSLLIHSAAPANSKGAPNTFILEPNINGTFKFLSGFWFVMDGLNVYVLIAYIFSAATRLLNTIFNETSYAYPIRNALNRELEAKFRTLDTILRAIAVGGSVFNALQRD